MMPKLDRLQARTLHGAPFGHRCARSNHVKAYHKEDETGEEEELDEEEEEEELSDEAMQRAAAAVLAAKEVLAASALRPAVGRAAVAAS